MSKKIKKKFKYQNLLIITSILFVMMLVFVYLAFDVVTNLVSTDGSTNTGPVYSIDEMDYHLRANATDYQVDLFNQLDDAIAAEVQDEATIAKLVVENFIADFYTFSNKDGNFDIGGMYYVYSPNRQLIYYDARDHFYKYLSTYIADYGKDALLEVESITATAEKHNDEVIDGVSYTKYVVDANWTYVEKDGGFDTSIFDTSAGFEVYINNDGRYEIVRTYGN